MMYVTLTNVERRELEACKRTFTISWSGRKVPEIDEIFYHWCGENKQPYVRITYRGKHADVFMDFPSGDLHLDSDGFRQIRTLCSEFGYPDQGDRALNGADELPKEKALAFAQRLAEIGHAFRRRFLARQDTPSPH